MHVRIKQAQNGTFWIKTTGNGAISSEFELDKDGLKQFSDGYLLALKARGKEIKNIFFFEKTP